MCKSIQVLLGFLVYSVMISFGDRVCQKDGQMKAVYRFLGPLRADLLRKSVERLYSFDVLLGGARKVRGEGVSRTHAPPRPHRRQSNIKASTVFRGALDRRKFFGSVGPCQQISGFPNSVRARVVKYQGINRISEHVRAGGPLVGEVAKELKK